jgi:hypothetical protein
VSLTTVAASLPAVAIEDPVVPWAKVEMDLGVDGGSFDQLPQAAQRLLLWMHRATGFGKEKVRMTTEAIAEATGRCERWVYKALRQCLDHERDGEAAPLVTKEFVKGPREAAGRVLGLNIPFAGPKEKQEKAKAKAKPGSKKGPAAAATAPPKPAPPPEEPAEPVEPGVFAAMWAMMKGQIIGGTAAATPKGSDEIERRKKEQLDALARRREAAGRDGSSSGAPGQPSGP